VSADLVRSWLKRGKEIAWNLLLMVVGSALCAAAVNGILVPREFVSSGVTGVALVIYYLWPGLSVGTLYFLLNIPLFFMGWRLVGRRFFGYSIIGMVTFSFAVHYVQITIPVDDKILSALLAGIITGVGAGIVLRSAGSAGGTDILSVILLSRFSMRLGTTLLAFNSGVLLLTAALFSLEQALYTLIFLYVSAHIVNLVVTGLNQRKAVFIISPLSDQIAKGIMEDMSRGVTILQGEGGYSRQREGILYTVVTFRELSRLKQLVRRIDTDAFVVVNETLEVMGRRIGNQPHW